MKLSPGDVFPPRKKLDIVRTFVQSTRWSRFIPTSKTKFVTDKLQNDEMSWLQ